MKLTRDAWLGIGILFALIMVTVLAGFQQSKAPQIPYLSTSSAPDGALAFKLWLDQLGYDPAATSEDVFNPQSNVNTIFILQPIVPITDAEWKLIDSWVDRGGLLVLAGDNFQTIAAAEHFDFSMVYIGEQTTEMAVSSPLLAAPAITSKIPSKAELGLVTTRSDFLPLVSTNGYPLMISFEQGSGRVIISSTPEPFSNLGLKNDGNASLILNLLAFTSQKGTVWFDEWHHGFQSGGIVGPSQWLQRTPAGHAILFIVGVIFLALLFQGRGFGRPVPLAYEIHRRGPLEHVTAIANLNRKAGHGNEVLKQYHQRVKRHLGQRYRIDPSMNDRDYTHTLAQYNSSMDKDALLNLLQRLSQKNVSEAELLKLAAEAARWINE
jgi:hypothetical protein